MTRNDTGFHPRAARGLTLAALLVALCACGGGGGGGSGPPDPVADVTVSGRVTFDRVPTGSATGGLDYDATQPDPARGVVVEAVDGANRVVRTVLTDDDGRYAFEVAANLTVTVRAQARMLRSGPPSWDFQAVDNTSDGLLYAIESLPQNLGTSNQVVNLRAVSGWDGASYADPRAAAPFAILDTVYEAVQLVLEADPAAVFPPLLLNWSPLNRESNVFDPDSGQIVTTAYITDTLGTGIYVLGDEGIDTDEYDTHVLAHEWGHYFEDRFARTDSTGGPHTLTATLDLRVALSEGWSNAFAGMALDDSLYVDTFGAQQSLGFSFDLEDNGGFNRGWYTESSVQSVLFDTFDTRDDGVDTVGLGFGPIFDVFTTAHADTEALTSIFSLMTPLKQSEPAAASGIDALLQAQDIVGVGMDIWASTETNDAGAVDVLPVYADAVIDGGPETVCSNPQFGSFNRLGVRQFLRFDVNAAGRYRFTATGPGGSDPDLVLFRRGFLTLSETAVPEREVFSFELEPGVHVLEVYEFGNLFTPAFGRACFDVTVEAI